MMCRLPWRSNKTLSLLRASAAILIFLSLYSCRQYSFSGRAAELLGISQATGNSASSPASLPVETSSGFFPQRAAKECFMSSEKPVFSRLNGKSFTKLEGSLLRSHGLMMPQADQAQHKILKEVHAKTGGPGTGKLILLAFVFAIIITLAGIMLFQLTHNPTLVLLVVGLMAILSVVGLIALFSR